MIKKSEIKSHAKQYKIKLTKVVDGKRKPKTKKELVREIEEHEQMHGEGLYDYIKPLHNMVKPYVRNKLHNAVNKYANVDRHLDKLHPYIGHESVKHIRRSVKPALHHVVDKVGDYTGAYGLKGEGVFDDVGRAFKKAGRQIVDTAKKGAKVYKQNVRPIVGPALKQGVKSAIEYGLPAAVTLAGAPELAPVAGVVASQISQPATDALGKATGAYGLKRGGMLKNDYSLKLDHVHPAMNPQILPHMVVTGKPVHGGSFQMAGSLKSRGRPRKH